jgi:6-bladed beta-propeller
MSQGERQMGGRKILIPILLILFPIAKIFPDVANKDKPQHGEWDFKLEKVWEIDSAGDEVLGLPQGILVSDDGILYLSDEANRRDYIFGPDGNFIRSFAARGEGPGEVRRHGRFFFVDDKVIIPDMGRIHYFTKEGEYLRTVNKDCEPHAFIDENRLIDAPLSAVFLPDGKGRITLCDLQSGKDTVISEFSAFEGGVARSSGMVMDVIVPVFSPLMTMGYSENRLYWGMSDRYMIHVTDLEGRDITSFSVDRKKTRVSKGDKWNYFKKDNMPADMLKQLVDSLPDEVTNFHRIEVHNKLIFVFVPDIDLENKTLRIRQIDIFSPEGRYLYKAHLKFGKNRVHLSSPLQNIAIKSDFLYAVLQDEEDNVLVAKYKISLPRL